jgi:hypothetical protein
MRRFTRTAMSSSSNTSIAKKARTKAEADFATCLMMAKLGGFDDLNAQSFLTNYRTRLETISEAESTAVAVREVYSAYYSELEAWARRRNQKLANQRQKAKSGGSREGLNLSPVYRLRAIHDANDPKIPPGTAGFRGHGGSDCRI